MAKTASNAGHDPAVFSHYRRAGLDLYGTEIEHTDPVSGKEAAVWVAVCALLSVLSYVALSS